MEKPEKIYLQNPNLLYALCNDKPDIGTKRETFFMNQLTVNHKVAFHKTADFIVDGKYVFEIGGRTKGTDQIQNVPDSWIAADNIEAGHGRKIPLWLFGFLY